MPQRFLKPGIVSSRKWDGLSWIGQSFYVRILTLVDDFGRYEADPMLLKSQAFPLRENIRAAQVLELCKELSLSQLALFYKADGKDYLQLTNWTERARSPSKYPKDGERILTDSINPQDSAGFRSGPQPPKSSSKPSSSPKSSPSPASPSSARVHESVGRPTWEEVRDYALSPHCGLAEWKARDWFDEMEGCGWLDYQHRPIEKWKAVLNRVKVKWEADGRPSGPKAVGQNVPLWQQIKAIESLLSDIERQLNAIPIVNGDLYPREAEQAKLKRAPLIERRKQLRIDLAALNARAAGGQL